ncbi:MAG: ATP-dependent RecD-like DNA helicase [Kiritimatiellae bacterium]|nr:ATP-dependent RecD-like DNA helicase [Kiritimatiellia bacterium]
MAYRQHNQFHRKPKPAAPRDPHADALDGTVSSVVYRNEDTGYTVCRVALDDQKGEATLVGNCAAIWSGESVQATGKWIRHPQHGFQFEAEAIVCIAPTSTRGIERYLSSGMIRGIRKELAKRLVRKFGERTLDIIEKESKRLEDVDGIGPKRRRQIKESWGEQKAVRDIMIFLQGHGIGTAQAARIFRQYGDQSVALIRQNAYRLCGDVWGIGFKTADGVAMSLGVAPDSELRARAGIIHVLQTLTDSGHCYCPLAELLLQAETLLGIAVEILTPALDVELKRGTLTKENEHVYLTPIYRAECTVVERVKHILSARTTFKPIIINKALPWAEEHMHLHFAAKQTEALSMALSSKFSIMTGGPGVGKTTIIRALSDVYKKRRLQVVLAAPTGRAAKRMEEATHHEAKTVHRLLKYQPQTHDFEHGSDNPLEGDVFILDEVSMMDIRLMSQFLEAVPNRACLVLVGDIDQLPSVGPGNVLRDLIHSGVVPCTRLDTVFRQQTGGWIIHNAHRVNRGELIEQPPKGEDSDFFFIETTEPDAVIARTIDLVTRRIPQRFGFDPLKDIQVLTPMRRNQLGAENLNAVLQEAMNPSGREIDRFGRKYRINDRVMQIRNNYDKEVFNGDIGRILTLNSEDRNLVVDYDGRKINYEYTELDELIHAYACSIHKSQGSEYPAVVILLTTQHFKLLQRNLLYTAITRGKKLVCLVGSNKAVYIATKNNEIQQRRTGLRERLSNG